MPRTRSLPVLLAALFLAVFPVAALGQSAGDDQYEDPFGGAPQEQPTPAPTASAPTAPDPAPAPAQEQAPAPASPAPSGGGSEGATSAPAQPAPASAAAPATASASAANGEDELPRTGLDAGPIAGLGMLLLAGGVALRVRLHARP